MLVINLLPPTYKQGLQREQKIRLVFILLVLLFLFFVSVALLLLAIRIYLQGELESHTIALEIQKADISENRELRQQLVVFNATIKETQTFYERQVFGTAILEEVARLLPPEVRLRSFTYTPQRRASRGEDTPAHISLSGLAATRSNLLAFSTALEQSDVFVSVSLPPSFLKDEADVSFTLTADLSQERLQKISQ